MISVQEYHSVRRFKRCDEVYRRVPIFSTLGCYMSPRCTLTFVIHHSQIHQGQSVQNTSFDHIQSGWGVYTLERVGAYGGCTGGTCFFVCIHSLIEIRPKFGKALVKTAKASGLYLVIIGSTSVTVLFVISHKSQTNLS